MDSTIDYKLIYDLISGQISRALNAQLTENFSKSGLAITADQWNVLRILLGYGEATLLQICKETSMTKALLTRMVHQLEGQKIVERFHKPEDMHTYYVRLTPNGEEIYEEAQYVATKTLNSVLHGLTTEQVCMAQKCLKTVMGNLNRQGKVASKEKISELLKFFYQRKKWKF